MPIEREQSRHPKDPEPADGDEAPQSDESNNEGEEDHDEDTEDGAVTGEDDLEHVSLVHIRLIPCSRTQVYFSEAQRMHFQECFNELLSVAAAPGGVHPKLGKPLSLIFKHVAKMGNDIAKHKRRRVSLRTWKDSSSNTLYLD
jgi:hypothetical protein